MVAKVYNTDTLVGENNTEKVEKRTKLRILVLRGFLSGMFLEAPAEVLRVGEADSVCYFRDSRIPVTQHSHSLFHPYIKHIVVG